IRDFHVTGVQTCALPIFDSVAEVVFNAATDDEFTRWVVTLSLSDALRFDFTGHSPYRIDASINYTGKTRVRDTNVADATRYYGITAERRVGTERKSERTT